MSTREFDKDRRHLIKLAGIAAAAATIGINPTQAHGTPRSHPRLFFTDVGKGTNVLLLHGWTCDSHDWSWQLPLLESKYRVVAVDLRGHGRSDVPPSGAYNPSDYVGDVERLISSRYPGEKFVVTGHSMGGQIGARLAATRPDLVRALVSIDGALGFSDEVGMLFAKAARALVSGDPAVVVPAFLRPVYDKHTNPAWKRWHARRVQGMPAHVVRESFGPLFVGPAQVGVGEASGEFCKTLKLPVYHLCRDPVQADRMRPWFTAAGSKVDVWTDAGHWIMQDRVDDVNHAVTQWIDAL